MKRYLVAAGVFALAACAPDIEKTEAPNQIVARFDPAQTPPVVPTPNDLAANPATGQLAITPAPGASDIDIEFTSYLNQLNGFPASSVANATFTGKLDKTSVTTQTVRVYDVTNNYAKVTDATPSYADTTDSQAPGLVSVLPSAGWTPGHSYLVAVVGGDSGVKGADGQKVVGSSTWSFLKSENSLVTCTDLTSKDCKSTTAVIPGQGADPAAEDASRNANAVQLEQLRLKYKPTIDKLISDGIARQDIALAWTFRISDDLAMAFDPAAATPVVPKPNDLAIDPKTGLVNAPIDPNSSAANQEFTRDYVNSLNGFPVASPGSALVAGGDLNPSTVNANTVIVTDLTPGSTIQPTVALSYDSATHQILFPAPTGGWLKGHEYGAVVVGGANGVKGTTGNNVVASTVWALARSKAPIADCSDPADPSTCTSLFTVSPISDEQAGALEQVRSAMEPFLDTLEAEGIPRSDVAVGWTFRIMDHPEATFDPLTQTIPFPNDIVRNPTTGKINLPVPTGNPTQAALITGLNTLNGWSLTAPIVSENGATVGPLTDSAKVDEASLSVGLDGGSTVFIPLAGATTTQLPLVKACVNCAVSRQADGGTSGPETLEWVPEAPLAENTTYAVALKTNVKSTDGKTVRPTLIFALARMQNSLLDSTGHSTVDGVSDAQATLLEQLRLGLKPVLDALNAAGTARKDIALAWAFTTETVVNGTAQYPGLRELHNVAAAAAVPVATDYLADITANIPAQVPKANIAKFYQGTFHSPFLLTGTQGTFGGAPIAQRIPFTLTIPTGTAPAGGWPVVIFGHGLAGYREQSFAIVNTLATAGYATIFIDVIFHGDRSSCAGVHLAVSSLPSDDAACGSPTTVMCDNTSALNSGTFGKCIARNAATRIACASDADCSTGGLGRCLDDNKCAGGDFLRTAAGAVQISGWNFINTVNLFATRDDFRQEVVDLGQLARVIAGPAATAGNLNNRLAAGETLDATKINYAGISLGGILGTLYVASAPEVHHAVLNVPGGDPAGILLTSPSFAAQRNAFLATLAGQGVVPGSPQFDQFIYFAHMILDAADPAAAGWDLNNAATAPADRKTLIQYISRDQTVPNGTTEELIAAATRADAPNKSAVFQWDFTDAEVPLASRHGFLLNGVNPMNLTPSPTARAQAQLATYLVTGVQP